MNSNSMFLSVVIPLYNKEKSISRAVSSVLAQDYGNFELIIVDDGSTDQSVENISVVKDERLSLVRKPNGGVSDARNAGAAVAKSDYVCFLDADDEWRPHFLTRIAGLIAQNPSAYIFSCRYETVTEKGELVLGQLNLAHDHRGLVPRFFSAYRKSRSLIHSSSVCVSKSALMEMGGFPKGENVGEDVYVWLSLALRGEVMFDAEVSSRVHQDAENRTVVRVAPKPPFFLESFLGRDLKDEDLRDFILSFAVIYAAISVSRGSRKLALDYSKKTLKHSISTSMYCLFIFFSPKFIIDFVRNARINRRKMNR
jgi:glycosyltransferase involved in cell wall biosynthesis